MGRVSDLEFEHVYGEQVDRLTRLGFLVCGDERMAEDAVSAAVSRVLPRWRAGRVVDPSRYLRRAVLNELMGGFRRRTAERRAVERFRAPSPVDQGFVEGVIDRDALWVALVGLPQSQRAVVVLRYYEDLTEEQTAEVLGVNVGTVKSRMSRAVTRMRTLLEEECSDA
jgi:RNA polymerase sigma-70 factor (sigma-E family)